MGWKMISRIRIIIYDESIWEKFYTLVLYRTSTWLRVEKDLAVKTSV
jgi:hypothetical protein